VIAGEGPQLAELAARARAHGIAELVRFTGRVSEEAKWRLYDSAHVLLFASELEGFGLVVAEAQSRGVPVIAAAGTGSAEALDPGRSGFLVAPDAEAFAVRVRELADERVRLALSSRAREFAARFDWDACAAGVAGIYREVTRSYRAVSLH
jgi:glycosyltransferase involved in cell wall biosynthesis